MASVTKTPQKTFRVRYRDPAGRSHGRTFKRLADARAFAADVESSKNRNAYVDPRLARRTVDQIAREWFAVIDVAPRTWQSYRGVLNTWVLPFFQGVEVGRVDRAKVREFAAWMRGQGAAQGTVDKALAVTRLVLGHAVDQGAISSNPANKLALKRIPKREMMFLSAEQVERLATEADEWGDLILFAAYTGLRAGEIAGLKVRRVEENGGGSGWVTVAESVIDVAGRLETAPTKTRRVRRVQIPAFVMDAIRPRLEGRGGDEYVFGRGSRPMSHHNFYSRKFRPATDRAGLEGLRFHDLRHTYAALLIGLGAHSRAIMERMGHSSITVTLGTYGHLLPGIDEGLTEGLNSLGTSRD